MALKCWAYELGMANINYGNRFLQACTRMMSEEMETYPFYPIQSICEQADFCKDGNVARLRVLKKSAEQHRTKYCVEHYNFIIEHITGILRDIKDKDRREDAKRQIEDY